MFYCRFGSFWFSTFIENILEFLDLLNFMLAYTIIVLANWWSHFIYHNFRGKTTFWNIILRGNHNGSIGQM